MMAADTYVKPVTKWCRKMEASSLAKSSPGHSLRPPPKGVKPQVLVSLPCRVSMSTRRRNRRRRRRRRRRQSLYFPSPWIEAVGLLVEVVVEVDRSEVGEHAPSLGDQVPFDLHIFHGLAHDAANYVPHTQRLCYDLYRVLPC